jgi:uroporphyrinogen decarboxylase
MKTMNQNVAAWPYPVTRQPDFNCLLAVLRRERPERPAQFEFSLNGPLCQKLADPGSEARLKAEGLPEWWTALVISAQRNAGYDAVVVAGSDFSFPRGARAHAASVSLNDGGLIRDRASFERFVWPDPDAADASCLDRLAAHMPVGMKLIVWGPGGVLENVIALIGYETLCMLLADDPELVEQVFVAVGQRLVRYYTRAASHPAVGALLSNDDWGFKTQTLLSPQQLRHLVFPWHAQIVTAAHAVGKPAILHSCGKPDAIMDDIIDGMHYDAKHSFEDSIIPVEDAYERWGRRIAILGGMDVDFVARSSPEAVRERARAMLRRTADRGGYALGTGNSVPESISATQWAAMAGAALESVHAAKRR